MVMRAYGFFESKKTSSIFLDTLAAAIICSVDVIKLLTNTGGTIITVSI